ncbi:hypothetical protein SDJN03_26000, partial [Cucurbita argyrosperma subsp. sororia]
MSLLSVSAKKAISNCLNSGSFAHSQFLVFEIQVKILAADENFDIIFLDFRNDFFSISALNLHVARCKLLISSKLKDFFLDFRNDFVSSRFQCLNSGSFAHWQFLVLEIQVKILAADENFDIIFLDFRNDFFSISALNLHGTTLTISSL